jgi:monofunctional biosynthetic peptidoglycan transglycosylase
MPPSTASKGKSRPSRTGSKRLLVRFVRRPLRWIRNGVLIFFGLTVLVTLFFGVVPPPFTPLMVIRCGERWMDDKDMRMSKDWTPLDEMSPYIVRAVIASEDQNFFNHRGFDFESIVSAFAINRKGKRKLGASTISQQTAKNLFLWPERSWSRKGLEAYFTLLMETSWTKRRILAMYLNVIETGDGIYGIEAASRHYFGVPASRLDKGQAALLAAILPNPRRWNPNRPTPYLWARQAWIMHQMDFVGMPENHGKQQFRTVFKRWIGIIFH